MVSDPVEVHVPQMGSYNSALENVTGSSKYHAHPPSTRTLPFARSEELDSPAPF
jgi:hypothetical protein